MAGDAPRKMISLGSSRKSNPQTETHNRTPRLFQMGLTPKAYPRCRERTSAIRRASASISSRSGPSSMIRATGSVPEYRR